MKTNFIPGTWFSDDLIIDVDESLFMVVEDTLPASTPSTPSTPDDQAGAKDKQQ